jgi:hypothetical protein
VKQKQKSKKELKEKYNCSVRRVTLLREKKEKEKFYPKKQFLNKHCFFFDSFRLDSFFF